MSKHQYLGRRWPAHKQYIGSIGELPPAASRNQAIIMPDKSRINVNGLRAPGIVVKNRVRIGVPRQRLPGMRGIAASESTYNQRHT